MFGKVSDLCYRSMSVGIERSGVVDSHATASARARHRCPTESWQTDACADRNPNTYEECQATDYFNTSRNIPQSVRGFHTRKLFLKLVVTN